MIYGYARVSTKGQAKNGNSLEEQREAILSRYPKAEIVDEAFSGAKIRPAFSELISGLERGDVLVVTKLDRFCRTTKEGLQYIDTLMEKGVSIHILNMGLIEDTAIGRLIVTNLLAFAEFERAMIVERTQGGKEIARQRPGYREGRKPIECDLKRFELLADMVSKGAKTVTDASKELGVSRAKWYRLINDAV